MPLSHTYYAVFKLSVYIFISPTESVSLWGKGCLPRSSHLSSVSLSMYLINFTLVGLSISSFTHSLNMSWGLLGAQGNLVSKGNISCPQGSIMVQIPFAPNPLPEPFVPWASEEETCLAVPKPSQINLQKRTPSEWWEQQWARLSV